MVRYNPDYTTQEFTKTEILRPFKGVSVRNRDEVSDLPIEDSAILWVQDMILVDGNLVYVDGTDSGTNPFIYRSNSQGKHSPSQRRGSILVSAPTGEKIEFTNTTGWGRSTHLDTARISIHPIADDYVLEQLGEEEKLLIHEI